MGNEQRFVIFFLKDNQTRSVGPLSKETALEFLRENHFENRRFFFLRSLAGEPYQTLAWLVTLESPEGKMEISLGNNFSQSTPLEAIPSPS